MSSLNAAVLDALSYSGNKKVIIEEVIEKAGTQIHGDGFVLNGNLVFTHLGDHHFSHISDVIPVATSWPSRIPANLLQKLISEIGKCVNRSGLQFGPINIEARIDINHNIYIIELAPRAGVHSGSDLTKLGAGVDLPLETMKYLDGQKVNIEKLKTDCVAYYILHSKLTGYFSELTIDPAVEKYITNLTIKANNGDKVRSYKNMKDAVGVINLMFDNREEMSKCMDQIDKFVSVVVK
jgi:biotin carboxylase